MSSLLLSAPVTTRTGAELGLAIMGDRGFELIGELPPRPRLAIVGSRAARRRILAVLGPMLASAGPRGWALVSGGALGVDAGAHRAALDHAIPQVAVLPCGRDRPYPPGNRALFGAMAARPEAALLFAQPLATRPTRGMFASRNAIVVALADAVLVAEASLRSGSLGTGRLALRRAVPLAAIADSPGCAALIGAGAKGLPMPAPDQPLTPLLAAFERWLAAALTPGAPSPASPPEDPSAGWPEPLAWLAEAIARAGPSGLTLDNLADPDTAVVALAQAELLGLVCEAAPGRWVRL